jgi:hypothetical protein
LQDLLEEGLISQEEEEGLSAHVDEQDEADPVLAVFLRTGANSYKFLEMILPVMRREGILDEAYDRYKAAEAGDIPEMNEELSSTEDEDTSNTRSEPTLADDSSDGKRRGGSQQDLSRRRLSSVRIAIAGEGEVAGREWGAANVDMNVIDSLGQSGGVQGARRVGYNTRRADGGEEWSRGSAPVPPARHRKPNVMELDSAATVAPPLSAWLQAPSAESSCQPTPRGDRHDSDAAHRAPSWLESSKGTMHYRAESSSGYEDVRMSAHFTLNTGWHGKEGEAPPRAPQSKNPSSTTSSQAPPSAPSSSNSSAPHVIPRASTRPVLPANDCARTVAATAQRGSTGGDGGRGSSSSSGSNSSNSSSSPGAADLGAAAAAAAPSFTPVALQRNRATALSSAVLGACQSHAQASNPAAQSSPMSHTSVGQWSSSDAVIVHGRPPAGLWGFEEVLPQQATLEAPLSGKSSASMESTGAGGHSGALYGTLPDAPSSTGSGHSSMISNAPSAVGMA